MAEFTQGPRPITVNTPLGTDKLLLASFSGDEAISQLFHFDLAVLAENSTDVAFEKLLGKVVTLTVALPENKKRYFSGICNRISQGERDSTFTQYRLEIVPQLWLLTKRSQSRIFQHLTVPEILKKVLAGLDVAYELQGTFEKRDYCVQYRESDFNFASRVMEEEGIYYYFKHSDGAHKMVVANTPQSHVPVPEKSTIIFEGMDGGNDTDERILSWEKTQEIRSGKVTLWDYCFEMQGEHFAAQKDIVASVPVGSVTHTFKVGGNDQLEIYDYPGEYAQRFDGIDRGGGGQAGEITKIFTDKDRTVNIRMQEEAVPGVKIQGTSECRNFTSGHKFTLQRHFNADGNYMLTSVHHSGKQNEYRSGGEADFQYVNSFTCIPLALPFRPLRVHEKPIVPGSQTGIVVGPPGQIIFVDKYGRVKVQFPWDREGRNNSDSSCWIRVSQKWAGPNWGSMHIPHVGHEVIVDFEEGDPDRPIIVGRVYNAKNMPPMTLPDNQTWSITRDYGDNEMSWQGKPGEQQIFIYCPTSNTTLSFGAKPTQSAPAMPCAPPGSFAQNPGPCPLPPPGKPEAAVAQEGVSILTKAFMAIFCGQDFTFDVLGDHHIRVKGSSHDNILGLKSMFIGGIKNEVIVGAEIKHLGGIKREFIFGAEMKTIKGMKWEKHNGPKFTRGKADDMSKHPNAFQYVKDKIKEKASNRITEVSSKIQQKASEYKSKVNKKLDQMKEGLLEAKGKLEEKVGKLKQAVKGKWDAKCNGAKMNLVKLALAAKLICNDGNFKVDK